MATRQATGPRQEAVRFSGVGKLIRDRRRELGITQAQLGEMIEKPQDWISKIELGVRTHRLTRERANQIAKALDLPVSALLDAEAAEDEDVREQIAELWEVGRDPARELVELLPRMARADVQTLVRLARVMAAGRGLEG